MLDMTPNSAGKEETEDVDGGNVFRHLWKRAAREECGYPEEKRSETVARLERQVKFHPGIAGELARLMKGTKR
jgi:hypothetical protein